jgi:hypothetical protein
VILRDEEVNVRMKRWLTVAGILALTVAVALTVGGVALAQSDTPSAQATPTPPCGGLWGKGFGFWRGGAWSEFDAIAKALNLTPTQLFEELHSGKTLAEIAEAQGVELSKVQEALQTARIQAMKDAIAKAVEDGKITQEQADWLLQGLEKGYIPGGRGFGFGFGPGMRGGMRGMRGFWGGVPVPAPSNSTTGTSS